ncbi:hypothetical protein SLS62_005949 [Diatrype stigma]|uniref:Cellulose-binding protein n=1 Tax=Diatrype stigma TaxID=117547 RepID=A0AAN9URF2_9PEZI
MVFQVNFRQVLLFVSAWAVKTCLATDSYGKQCEGSRYEHKPRVFIATDISNEPDDQMSLVRLLTYSNEIDIQAIGVITSYWKNSSIDVDTVINVVNGYGNVTENLNANVPAIAPYPSAEDLLAKVKAGHPVYGLEALEYPPSDAALALVAAADAATLDDPLYTCVWGGAGVVAEALQHVSRTRTPDQVSKFVHKLRVYSISDQDDAGAWLRSNYPSLFYVLSLHGFNDYSQASWNGISGEAYRHFDKGGPDTSLVTNEWLQTHIRLGALGAHYPDFQFIMEGDTPSFLPLLQNGLGNPEHPEWGSWGGRYMAVDGSGRYPVYSDTSDVAVGVDGDIHVSAFATIWRWRAAYQYDFAARMQWTLEADFSKNNHQPVAIVNDTCGPQEMTIKYKFGDSIVLDATESWDPDNDSLKYSWFHYREVIQRIQEGPIDPVSTDVNITNLDVSGGLVRIEPLTNIVRNIPRVQKAIDHGILTV